MNDAQEVAALLDERPDLGAPLEAALQVDDAAQPWTFEDLPVDSGRFGELVSRGVITKTSDGYQLANPQAVEQALTGEISGTERDDFQGPPVLTTLGLFRPTLPDRRLALALGGALMFLALLRVVFSFSAVFHDGVVVFSGNDPFYYRYWVEQLLLNPDLTLSSLPSAVAKGEPLYVATMWATAALLGGGVSTTGWLMAWFPVVSAVLSGGLLYLLTVTVTGDRRIGIASVLMLAVIAGHALRTSLGFPDHHAFDYPWLGLTALSFVLVVGSERTQWRRTIMGTVGIALGISAQVLAWEAGPLLIGAAGLSVAFLAIVWVQLDESPLLRGVPILAGTGIAAGVTWLVHTEFGWHTNVVASAPALLFAGSLGVLLVTEAVFRLRLDTRIAPIAVAIVGGIGLADVAFGLPAAWSTLMARLDRSLFRSDQIAEVQGLFGDSVGWLLLFGFVLVLAIPYLLWGTRRARSDPVWAVPAVYAWWFLGLSAIQVRFVGEFAPFAAVFAGLGFVHLAERLDVARRPHPFDAAVDGARLVFPTRQQAVTLVALFVLIGGLGLLQVPLKTSQITTPSSMYETTAWMNEQTDQPEWDGPMYVFTDWSHNRMHNYFVSGESRSYGFARGNYVTFLNASNSTRWYDRLRGRTGFVVYDTEYSTAERGSIATRLAANGSRTPNASGLAHYRAVYASADGQYRVFTLVPGATLTGAACPETTIQVATQLELSGETSTYARQTTTDTNGSYRITVPYPGQYTVGEHEIRVPEAAIKNGTNLPVTSASQGQPSAGSC
jgi:dolichyl-diphosphooligosaccharide--protein glycosyltransferase